jgi:hypothetical protein
MRESAPRAVLRRLVRATSANPFAAKLHRRGAPKNYTLHGREGWAAAGKDTKTVLMFIVVLAFAVLGWFLAALN